VGLAALVCAGRAAVAEKHEAVKQAP
jgi:hypothetical protein